MIDMLAEHIVFAIVHALWQAPVAGLTYLLLRPTDPRAAPVRYAMSWSLVIALGVAFAYCVWMGPTPAAAIALGLSGAPRAAWTPVTAVGLLWCAGVVLVNGAVLGRYLMMRRRLRREASAPPPWMQRSLRNLQHRLGITRAPSLWIVPSLAAPITFGVVRPVIAVPALLMGVPPQYLEALLAHELAHVRRYDFLLNGLQSLVEALLFFHPVVWWLSRQARLEREVCCDLAAAACTGSPTQYAKALLMCEEARSMGLSRLEMGAQGGNLMRRVQIIVGDDGKGSASRSSWGRGLAVAIIIATAAGLAGARPASKSSTASAPAWLPPAVARYWSEFARIGEREGVDPALLALVALVESGGDSDAVSPMGAQGLMQVMPATAERLAAAYPDLAYRPDRLRDPSFSITLAARYLRQQLAEFGDVEHAVSAYNAGPEPVRRHLSRGDALPSETQRYVDLLGGLWAERATSSSSRYEGWRQQVREWFRAEKVSPVPVGSELTARFGEEGSYWPEGHRGVDVAVPAGTPVAAPKAARVLDAGYDEQRGNYVVLGHASGLMTRYFHLGEVKVAPGDAVRAGDAVGTVGNTGQSTGPHLHLELLDHGTPIDPEFLVNDDC